MECARFDILDLPGFLGAHHAVILDFAIVPLDAVVLSQPPKRKHPAIMQLRLYAMYKQSRSVAIIMGMCFVSQIAVISTILATADLKCVSFPPYYIFNVSLDPQSLSPIHFAPLN